MVGIAASFLILPVIGYAQEATLNGTVTDSTGGVLPGVTITATNDETGNTSVAITDATGEFRLPVRIGVYRLTAELQGFATVTRTGVQLQVGQLPTMTLQLAPSSVQETVTVTGEAPLINITTSTATANIDQRQMQQLPLNGRNWLDLTLLAPGSRANTGGRDANTALADRSRSTWTASRSPTASRGRASGSHASVAIRLQSSNSSPTGSRLVELARGGHVVDEALQRPLAVVGQLHVWRGQGLPGATVSNRARLRRQRRLCADYVQTAAGRRR